MRKLNFIIPVIAFGLAFSPLALQAGSLKQQSHKSLAERNQSSLEYLSIVLELTESQQQVMLTLQTEHMAAVRSIHHQFKPILDQMTSELKDVRLDTASTFEQSKVKAKAVRNKFELQLEPMRDALKREQDTFNNELVAIFNSDQYEKYEALQAWKSEKGPLKAHPHKMRHPGEMNQKCGN